MSSGSDGVLNECSSSAEASPQPGVLEVGSAGQLAELGDRDAHDRLGVGAGPAGERPAAEQQVAGGDSTNAS